MFPGPRAKTRICPSIAVSQPSEQTLQHSRLPALMQRRCSFPSYSDDDFFYRHTQSHADSADEPHKRAVRFANVLASVLRELIYRYPKNSDCRSLRTGIICVCIAREYRHGHYRHRRDEAHGKSNDDPCLFLHANISLASNAPTSRSSRLPVNAINASIVYRANHHRMLRDVKAPIAPDRLHDGRPGAGHSIAPRAGDRLSARRVAFGGAVLRGGFGFVADAWNHLVFAEKHRYRSRRETVRLRAHSARGKEGGSFREAQKKEPRPLEGRRLNMFLARRLSLSCYYCRFSGQNPPRKTPAHHSPKSEKRRFGGPEIRVQAAKSAFPGGLSLSTSTCFSK